VEGKYARGIARTPLYILNVWSYVLKSLLMWLVLDKAAYGKLVESFFTDHGQHFGLLDSLLRKLSDIAIHADKDNTSTYSTFASAKPARAAV
jgi:hypothetical protein